MDNPFDQSDPAPPPLPYGSVYHFLKPRPLGFIFSWSSQGLKLILYDISLFMGGEGFPNRCRGGRDVLWAVAARWTEPSPGIRLRF